jgi:UDP-glucose 4-epimerase
MYLITGGLGFIGLHTAKSVLDAGEDVVLTQYRVAREPDFIKAELGKRAFVEQLDVTDNDRLMEIGRKHKITGIIHLAVPGLNALSAADDFKVNMNGLYNLLEAGREWEVKRIGLASSGAVYAGVRGGPDGLNKEDALLTIGAAGPANATATWKKCFELIGSYYAARNGMDIVNLRIAGIYGPLYQSMANLPSRLVHAAVKGEAPQLRGDTFAEDGGDSTYVKDCGKGIALLMTADKLNFNTYNIGCGRATTAGQIVSAIQTVIPSFKGDFLKEGASPNNRGNSYGDLTRIKADVGYEPEFPVEKAIPDYIGWIRAGNAE